jgi:hypothetical protein
VYVLGSGGEGEGADELGEVVTGTGVELGPGGENITELVRREGETGDHDI